MKTGAFSEYKREAKNPTSLIGREIGFCFHDSKGYERCANFKVESCDVENQTYGGFMIPGADNVRVTFEAVRRYYHLVYGLKECEPTALTDQGEA